MKSLGSQLLLPIRFWLKNLDTGTRGAGIAFLVNTSAGNRHVQFFASAGTNTYYTTGYYVIYMGSTPANTWHRGEYDIQQLLTTLTPGVTFNEVVDCYVYGKSIRLDDLRFSNSITVEHNIFGGGVVGHILRSRSINASTGAATDRWFHYDQVGSVISESNTAGTLAQSHHQDAFGNTQAAWNTGLWGGDRAGWHHNTKEYDIDIGAVYMYQRWYSAETGTFMSSAPYPVMMEHRYGFAINDPSRHYDPDGRIARRGWAAGDVQNNCEEAVWLHYDATDTNPGWNLLQPGDRTDDSKEDPDFAWHPSFGDMMWKVGPWDMDIEDNWFGGGCYPQPSFPCAPRDGWVKPGQDGNPNLPPRRTVPVNPSKPPWYFF